MQCSYMNFFPKKSLICGMRSPRFSVRRASCEMPRQGSGTGFVARSPGMHSKTGTASGKSLWFLLFQSSSQVRQDWDERIGLCLCGCSFCRKLWLYLYQGGARSLYLCCVRSHCGWLFKFGGPLLAAFHETASKFEGKCTFTEVWRAKCFPFQRTLAFQISNALIAPKRPTFNRDRASVPFIDFSISFSRFPLALKRENNELNPCCGILK